MRDWLMGFVYAGRGIAAFFRSGRNARVHLLAAVLSVALGAWLHLDADQWCLIILAIALVLAAEMVNTAVEKITDVLFPGRDEKAAQIKDLAAGAVLVCAIGAALIGLLVFVPRILASGLF